MPLTPRSPTSQNRFIARGDTAGGWATGIGSGWPAESVDGPDRTAWFGDLRQNLVNHWMVRQR